MSAAGAIESAAIYIIITQAFDVLTCPSAIGHVYQRLYAASLPALRGELVDGPVFDSIRKSLFVMNA